MKTDSRPAPARWRPLFERLEDRTVPSTSVIAVGADAGGGPRVRLLDSVDQTVILDFFAYEGTFTGGVRVGVGDFNADGVGDVVTAPGSGGGPLVKIFDGKTGAVLNSFFAFDATLTTGLNVAAADVTGDGAADVVVAPDFGGPAVVKVFDGKTGMEVRSVQAFEPTFTGGVNVAAGDVNGDGKADIVAGAGFGGGPLVRTFDGGSGAELSAFFAYDQSFRNGVFVSAADLTADGKSEIITGAGIGGGPHVNIFAANGTALSSFFAFDESSRTGVRVGAFALDAAGRPAVITAPATGGGEVRVFDAPGGIASTTFAPFEVGFAGGIFVAGAGLPTALVRLSEGFLGNFFADSLPAGPTLVTLKLDPIDIDLLGLQVKTSEIILKVSVEAGDGKLLGNLLTVVSKLVNLEGVNNAVNNVLSNVVSLVNSATLSVATGSGGELGTAPTATTTPILDVFVAPIRVDLLGVRVDTSPIQLTITAQSGEGQILGNVLTALANLFNPPLPDTLDLDFINSRLISLLDTLNATLPGIPAAPITVSPITETNQLLRLAVPPIDLNLLGLILQTQEIRVNADTFVGDGQLLGNVLKTLLNTVGATPENLNTLNSTINGLLAKVVGVLNASSLLLGGDALAGLSNVLKQLSLPDLVNTTGTPATVPVLNLAIATPDETPPVDVELLGLKITTSDIRAQLLAQTGEGQILGNLVYNVAHLLDPGGTLNLLTILGQLGL